MYVKLTYTRRVDRVDLFFVRKALLKLPDYVVIKLQKWAIDVEEYGLREIRKVHGYHDEPLKGARNGQRSIRLTRAYRAIYVELSGGEINIVMIKEVTNHEY